MTRAAIPLLLAAAGLVACSQAGGDNATPAAPVTPAAIALAPPATNGAGRALVGTWGGASGARCWAEVIEFTPTQMTYQRAGGSTELKTVRVSYKAAGPNVTQVMPDAGEPTSYTVTDADHMTDGAGCLFQRTD